MPFLLILILCFFASCSQTPIMRVEEAAIAPVKSDPPMRIHYEMGSLWSEQSKWNDLYNAAPSRAIGDTLTLKVGEDLRARVAAAEKAAGKGEDQAEAKIATKGQDGAANPSKGAESAEVIIREVLPRGIFVVASAAPLRLGGPETRVGLEAKVREKDINGDGGMNSEALFNTRLDIHSPKIDAARAEADRKASMTPEELNAAQKAQNIQSAKKESTGKEKG